MVDNNLAVGIIIGFGFGSVLTAGVFYALYLQISTELFQYMSDIKKTMGWLGVKIGTLANKED